MKLVGVKGAAAAAAALFVTIAVLAGGAGARPAAVGVQPVLTGLAFPAAFTFAPEGRIFYGLRFTGEIRVFDPATKSDTHFFTIPDVAKSGEQGLLGLAISPQYPTKPWVYAYVTRTVPTLENQLVRIKPGPGGGLAMQILFHTGAATNHNGGHIAFGPSGLLYAVVGENGSPSNAQDLGTTLGKVVRMTASGGVPTGNPFAGSHVWAYGIRNSFGFAFDPLTGRLWETENGPECNDELNRIVKAGNFAWGPSQTCSTPPAPPANTNQDGPSRIMPKRWYTPTIAPTGAAFCSGCGLGPDNEGRLFFGTYNTHEIRAATLNAKRTTIVAETSVYTHGSAVISIQAAPDGTLYFSTPAAIFKLVLT